MIEAYLVVY